MRTTPGILSIMLALALAVTGVALAGHQSSHAATGSEACSICMHTAGTASVTAPEPGAPFATSVTSCPGWVTMPPIMLPVVPHDHPVRAPPPIS